MKIKKIESYQVRLPLVSPFQTSYGMLNEKACDILVITDEVGNQGFGELVAFEQANYIDETLMSSRAIIQSELLPLLTSHDIGKPADVTQVFQEVKGNVMAKSALETAIWDLFAKRQNQPLATLFDVTKNSLAVGVSIGIIKNLTVLKEQVTDYLNQGYSRVKLKIAPGYDFEPLAMLRAAFPDLLLMADANSAYTMADITLLKKLDKLNLAMIEQPFTTTDFVAHSELQKMMQTPICLDENIRCLDDVKTAYALGSCQSINLKIPRVGGIQSALEISRFCQEKDILVWLGGMFESGIGRSLNLQFAAQACFTFPGDISASSRYFVEDIINESFRIENGCISLPQGPGLGVSLSASNLKKYAAYQLLYKDELL